MGREGIRRAEIVGNVGALGPVIFFDDVEGLLKWSGTGTGVDFGVTKDATLAFMGDHSLKIITRGAAQARFDWVRASFFAYKSLGRRHTMEYVFRTPNMDHIYGIYFWMFMDDGAFTEQALIWYNAETDYLMLRTRNEVDEEIVEVSDGLASDCWHRLSFEVDMSALTYQYVTLNGVRTRIDNVLLNRSATADTHRTEYCMQVVNRGVTGRGTCFFDQLLVKDGTL